jgi:protoporphyrinogen oxidase
VRGPVVVGAGLTGLSAAYHLAQRGITATVLEKAGEAGGACRTSRKDGFDFDLTGHLLHLARPESGALLDALGVRKALRAHRRRAGVALAGTVTPYPIQINTHRLPREVRRDCLLGFVEARLHEADSQAGSAGGTAAQEANASFADWVLARFGSGFARHFFFPYNRKLFGVDPGELTTEWVGRFVPRPETAEVIDGALGLYRGAAGYNAAFLYPRRGGIRLLADALAGAIPSLRLSTPVREVRLGAREITLDDGETVGWDALVATMPLTDLVAITADATAAMRAAASRLRAVGVVNLNLGVQGRAPRREHWLYVPEERFPFYRVGLPSNHGDLAPRGCHTLSVEVSVPAGAPAPEGLVDGCLAGLEGLGLLRDRRDVHAIDVARLDPAYVIFDVARRTAVAELREAYGAAGVVLSGRWAEWKYSTMEDALWDGAAVARRIAP